MRETHLRPDDGALDVTALVKTCHQALTSEKREWLNARGISDSCIRRFCLGQLTTAIPAGLQLPDYLLGSVTIPYILRRKGLQVRKIRFRMFWDPPGPKYMDLEGEKEHLYNLQPTVIKFGEPQIYICEGEFDAIIMEKVGYKTIAVPGASSFNGNWKFLFTEDRFTQITLVFDGDDAGHKGSNRVKSILGSVNSNVRQVFLPAGFDVTDVYLSQGAHKLRELIDGRP